jgi:hypothetical protein
VQIHLRSLLSGCGNRPVSTSIPEQGEIDSGAPNAVHLCHPLAHLRADEHDRIHGAVNLILCEMTDWLPWFGSGRLARGAAPNHTHMSGSTTLIVLCCDRVDGFSQAADDAG